MDSETKKSHLFECVPADGSSINNQSLRDCWEARLTPDQATKEEFDRLRDELVRDKKISKRAGAGGGTYRLVEIQFTQDWLDRLFGILPEVDEQKITYRSAYSQWRTALDQFIPLRIFEAYRDRLIEQGRARKGRGRGGMIGRSNEAQHRREEELVVSMFNLIPSDGSTITNGKLRNEWFQSDPLLGEDDHDLYWKIRSFLLDRGDIAKGPCKGGLVYRLQPIIDEENIEQVELPVEVGLAQPGPLDTAPLYPDEKSLYAPLISAIRKDWAMGELELFNGEDEEDGGSPANYVITNSSNRKGANRGKWGVPDMTMVIAEDLELMGPFLEVVTFEVKKRGCVDVTGVHEAAAHTAIAHRSYFFIHCKGTDELLQEVPQGGRILAEAQRFGVGLVTFDDPSNADTWTLIVPPKRHHPDPLKVHSWLDNAFKSGEQDRGDLEHLIQRTFRPDFGLED